MMESANFIPLGGVTEKASFDSPMTGTTVGFRGAKPGERGPKVIGSTKEERSRIAREIRLAARKEKKKAKSDAKKARKLNGILTRRATRNPEKYSKNKERNRLHAIDVERYKIRLNAIKQAEKLAAIHDPSGASFNVGPVVILEDGTVKSKKALERRKSVGEKGDKKENVEKEANGVDASKALDGVNPERVKLLEESTKPHISKNAQKKKAKYEPKPVPPKPTIPKGIEIPEGEENWLKLWDLSDGDIERRLHSAARKAGDAKREARKRQKEEARFRRLMKAKRRSAMRMDQLNAIVKREMQRVKKDLRRQEKAMGVYDKEPKVRTEEEAAALKEARKKRKAEKKAEQKAKKEEEEKNGPQPKKLKGKEAKKARKEQKRLKKEAKFGKGTVTKEVQQPQESEERQQNGAAEEQDRSGDLLSNIEMALDIAAAEPAGETKEERKARREKKKAEKAAAKEKKAAPVSEPEPEPAPAAEADESKKRKRSKEEKESKKEHKRKKSSKSADEEKDTSNAGADMAGEQWNADALDGNDQRKSKFLRLLGAGKNAAGGAKTATEGKDKKDKRDIEKVQSELERQYEMGMKMKHDGGAKRRGLGA
ncbi:wound-responsive ked protein [Rutstroemia sp. NJR-2017a BBW]|nr:wound-responsive ked protein [Rutstroemia sp. NJR-2017a BBW]